jgi:tripartite ATP-independent transporter DctM subunit
MYLGLVLLTIFLMLVLMLFGMPIGFAMAFVGVLSLFLTSGGSVATGFLTYYPFDFASEYTFTVIPMFILMGQLAFEIGFTRELFTFTRAWLGRLPGGLALGTIAGCAIFAACCGSSVATAAAMGKISIPEMRRFGYDKRIAAGSVASGGTLGILIPPSIFLALYGVMTGTSIGKLLIAGFLPGLLSAGMFMISVMIRGILNPRMTPPVPEMKWRERVGSIRDIWGIVSVATVVLGTIYTGVCTPTEAGAIGVLGVIVLGGVSRRLNLRTLGGALMESTYASATIFVIGLGAMLIAPLFTLSELPQVVSQIVTTWDFPPVLVLFILAFVYLILGMFIDALSLMLITLPVIFPTTVALGVDSIWFGVLMVKFIELALMTPPVGMNLYIIKAIAPDFSMEDIFRGVIWFVVADICTLTLLILFPQITLWLPSLMK